ncbi:TetR/AcrR family transcriptional regulator [Pedobacter insulae]|uniref:DNA-binding transcriptional regulator, AcrR family n=1 Tax=Pedobacter insulae TaxID=414048 RepID=A0A1I2Z9S9_9SPHI|nr:TetR/AcrR family transcriptional regulator [Pedobacter insulae]SFH34622.1 DNA-binding transcriptional regulator, AcrR family [Pedobacter insulae]
MISKSAQTKQFIIEKAAPLFNKKGFAATSMNDILTATGLAKGGVYGNFESKEEIALMAFEYANDCLMNALSGKIRQEVSAYDKLVAIFNFYYNYSIDPVLEGGCPLLNTAIDSDFNFPELKEKAAQALTKMLGSLEYIINKGISNKEFRKKVNAKAESSLIFSVIEGGMMMSRLNDDPRYLNNLLAYLKVHVKNYKKKS